MGVILIEVITLLDPERAAHESKFLLEKLANQLPLWLRQLPLDCLSLSTAERPSFKMILKLLKDGDVEMNGLCHTDLRKQFQKTLGRIEVNMASFSSYSSFVSTPSSAVAIGSSKVLQTKKGPRTARTWLSSYLSLSKDGNVSAMTAKPSEKQTSSIWIERPLLVSRNKRRYISAALLLLLVGILLFLVLFLTLVVLKTPAISSSSSSSNNTSATSTASSTSHTDTKSWGGVNSRSLFALSDSDQDEIVAQLAAANVKVIRVYIQKIFSNDLHSSASSIPDIEYPVGIWNDLILERIDALMVKTVRVYIKLILVLHNHYFLGCYTLYDAYTDMLGIFIPKDGKCADVSNFYTDPTAIAAFDDRIKHILSFKSPNFNNRPWSSISEAIFAFDIQNLGQGWDKSISDSWWCNRAAFMRKILTPEIRISSGGSINLQSSLSAYTNYPCSAIDIIGLSNQFGNVADWKPRQLLPRDTTRLSSWNTFHL